MIKSAFRRISPCLAAIALAAAPGARAAAGTLWGADYPSFRQEAGERLSLYASNPGSRRWSCDARWASEPAAPGGSPPRRRDLSFHVHPHSRDELVGSIRAAGFDPDAAAPAQVRCRAD